MNSARYLIPQIILVILLLSAFRSSAQEVTNGDADDILFLYEVKQIDEFLERFNDERFSFIRTQLRNQGKENSINRLKLLGMLFNMHNPRLNHDTMGAFARFVLNPEHPATLYFTDSNWYASARCSFTYNGKAILIPILLHIKKINPDGVRWMIAGIGNPSFLNNLPAPTCIGPSSPQYHFIPSSSHTNRFLSLHRAFGDNTNLTDYFEPYLLNIDIVRKFISAICAKSLKLVVVKQVKFHFFQLDQWIFTVERFERNTTNKGWLINKLAKMSEQQKQTLRYSLLFPN